MKTIKENLRNKPMRFSQLVLVLIIVGCSLMSQNLMGQQTLTLQEAIKIAQQKSPNIKKSKLNLYGNQRSLDAQRASLKSRFSLDVTPFDYNRNRNFNDLFSQWNTNEDYNSFANFSVTQPIVATDGSISLINQFGYRDNYSEFQDVRTKTFSNNLYLQLEQPIFTYNRTKLQLKELELNLENAQISNSIQLLSLEQEVTQSFYNFYQRQNNLEIASDEYENQKISYEITLNKVEADLLAKEELYQAELNLASSKSTLENNEVLLNNAADDFKLLLGLNLDEDIEVAVDIDFITRKVDLAKAIEHGLEHRMELRQRGMAIERSQFELTRTKALNEFKGSVSLSLGVFGDNEQAPEVYEQPNLNPRVAVSFNIPIWDWGENRARMDAANANLEINKVDLQVEENNIIIGIRKIYRNLQNLENQISIAEQNVKNAKLTYDINLERYKNGDLTSIDLNRFQSQLSEKKGALADALINYKMELLNLKVQSLYDFEKNQPVMINRY
ncbi:TolC family protein [Marivirga tractuosa]|uniref:Outer membrane efflux protein n=1 Tax=Marivirga tractuosa (strain ATCC 23168 / DSM 4126 / NBRC 15989 / NCIMB 1408 / VKM B-1430 / H-43) TaxID=643867 RepID=E4TUW2_MARTH|nr:TolC family protein [Marivirga tractuosa]ADR21067.1 outer membrane efflux protein [Marivirga tractuosa DSM 4126]